MRRHHFIALFVSFLALPVLAQNMCMDCTQTMWEDPDGTAHSTANCCMAVKGHCYENDVLIQQDVGYGCLVSKPDENGNTTCASTDVDKGCTGGTKKPPAGTVIGDGGCTYDETGWCDISCSSCTWT